MENNPQNEADKLNAIANIVAASGGVLGNVSGFFNKGQPPVYGDSPAVYIEDEKAQKNQQKNKQMLYIGGAVIAVLLLIMIFKK